jgi:hypothetical protein
MATGTLANGELTLNVEENVYSIPSDATGGYAVVRIKMLNIGSSDMTVRASIHTGTVTPADYIEYDTVVPPKGYLERSGVVIGAGQAISLWCTDSANCVFTINGTEVNVPDPTD